MSDSIVSLVSLKSEGFTTLTAKNLAGTFDPTLSLTTLSKID